jgi:hypothetical protein
MDRRVAAKPRIRGLTIRRTEIATETPPKFRRSTNGNLSAPRFAPSMPEIPNG